MNIDTEVAKIIERDYELHHQGRAYGVDRVLQVFNNLSLINYSAKKYGSVVIAYTKLDDAHVEFHCHNAGNTNDLISAVNQFNKDSAEDYAWSVTYYDNPKINALLKHSLCPCEFAQIDQGEDRTYEAKFRLRST
jgi:hypothetical protein